MVCRLFIGRPTSVPQIATDSQVSQVYYCPRLGNATAPVSESAKSCWKASGSGRRTRPGASSTTNSNSRPIVAAVTGRLPAEWGRGMIRQQGVEPIAEVRVCSQSVDEIAVRHRPPFSRELEPPSAGTLLVGTFLVWGAPHEQHPRSRDQRKWRAILDRRHPCLRCPILVLNPPLPLRPPKMRGAACGVRRAACGGLRERDEDRAR